MPSRIPLSLTAILCMVSMARMPAGDVLDRPLTIRLWNDLADEAFIEINRNLDDQTLAWHVLPSLGWETWPGITLEVEKKPLREVLTQMAAIFKLEVRISGRHVWMFRPADPAKVKVWETDLSGADANARIAAASALAAAQDPACLNVLLKGLLHTNPEVVQATRIGLTKLMGVSFQALKNPLRYCQYVLGTCETPPGPSYIGEFGSKRSGPWVAWYCLFQQDPAAKELLTKAVAGSKRLATDLILLAMATTARLPAAEAALTEWSVIEGPKGKPTRVGASTVSQEMGADVANGGSWWPNVMAGKALSHLNWMKNPDQPVSEGNVVVDHPAKVKKANDLAAKIMALSTLDDKGMPRRFNDQESRQINDSCNALAGLMIPEAIPLMGNILVKHVSVVARETVATGFSGYRDPDMVPFLAEAFTNDKELGIRSKAARSLGECRQPKAIEVLKKGLGDAAASVRIDAARGLGFSHHPTAGAAIKTVFDQAGAGPERDSMIITMALARDRSLVTKMQDVALNAAVANERQVAVGALGLVLLPETVGTLVEAGVKDTESKVAEQVVDALIPRNFTDCSRSVPALIKIYEEAKHEKAAERALVALTMAAALLHAQESLFKSIRKSFLEQSGKNGNGNVRMQTVAAFGRHIDIDDEVVATMEANLKDEKAPVVRGTIQQLLRKAGKKIGPVTK